MKVYKIKVNGKAYRVELESVEEVAASKEAKSIAPIPESKPAEAPKAAAPVSSGEGKPVTSPIQGGVIDVKVKVGDRIKKGDVVAIVEAMKLENEVVSTLDGVVAEVLVSKGMNVTSGQALISVK